MPAAKFIVIDTETSGLFDFAKPADAPGQPRMASLAMLFCDAELQLDHAYHALIRPEGWVMDAETAKLHGLTQEKLAAEGIPVRDALGAYAEAVDWGHAVIAYNAQYDTKILRGEFRRAGLADRFETTVNIDCMRPCVGVCKIPKAKGGGYKFPKLIEAYRHFYQRDPAGQHDALADAHACLAIAQALQRIGCLPEAAVHYARNRPDAPAPGKAVARDPVTGAAADPADIF